MKCKQHDAKDAVPGTFFGMHLCKQCADQIEAAKASVDRHVEPKECFLSYVNRHEGWKSFTQQNPDNTGCAHWVAHQLDIKGGNVRVCAEGFKINVRDVIAGARRIDPKNEEVKINDIWVNLNKRHTGLVVAISEKDDKKIYRIRHCSSGSGGVVEHNHTSLWGGKGEYYRF